MLDFILWTTFLILSGLFGAWFFNEASKEYKNRKFGLSFSKQWFVFYVLMLFLCVFSFVKRIIVIF